MNRTVCMSILFYIVILLLILFAKPDFLYDHNLDTWKENNFMNITTFSVILSVLIFIYIKNTSNEV